MVDKKIPTIWMEEKGIELLGRDLCVNNRGDLCSYRHLKNDYVLNSWYVTEFADRENTGKQPVADWVPVALCDPDGNGECHSTANYIEWALRADRNISLWKPNIEALYEIYLAEQEQLNHEYLNITTEKAQIIRNTIYACMVDNASLNKEDKKLKLTKEDIGNKFECNNDGYRRAKLVYISGSDRFCFENSGGGLFVTDEDGDFVTNKTSIVKRHEPRWWLSQLPDADLLDLEWLSIDNDNHIYLYNHEPRILAGCERWNGGYSSESTRLSGLKCMPKLKNDEWKLSKISIDELRKWQNDNKNIK